MKLGKEKARGTVNILIRSYPYGGPYKSQKQLTVYDTTWKEVFRVIENAIKSEEDADEQANR